MIRYLAMIALLCGPVLGQSFPDKTPVRVSAQTEAGAQFPECPADYRMPDGYRCEHDGQTWTVRDGYYYREDALPDAPQPQQTPPAPVKPKYLAFGGPYRQPLRSNKQVLTDPTFLIPIGGCAATMFTDWAVTHSAREHLDSEGPTVAAIAVIAYLSHRYLWAPFSMGLGTYCIEHYAHDAMQ